ncbi:MAG: phosphoglycerate kinase, partial [Clostridia bacterium]|nr:phosphoglycerate kinase [Clostridia bacterium]
IPADMMGLDIGTKTAEMFAEAVKSAKTVVWNGPMGVFENPTLAAGTIAVAKALAETDATTIIGGGASLEYLEGKELPGIAAMTDK